jgi:hypothetical protein
VIKRNYSEYITNENTNPRISFNLDLNNQGLETYENYQIKKVRLGDES